jgi:hypothetical protein
LLDSFCQRFAQVESKDDAVRKRRYPAFAGYRRLGRMVVPGHHGLATCSEAESVVAGRTNRPAWCWTPSSPTFEVADGETRITTPALWRDGAPWRPPARRRDSAAVSRRRRVPVSAPVPAPSRICFNARRVRDNPATADILPPNAVFRRSVTGGGRAASTWCSAW